MNAAIICIGDELLIGQTINTNASWLGKKIEENGIKCKAVFTIGDNATQIKNTLQEATALATIVFITGGLGPTKDDITKSVLCEYFSMQEKLHQPSYDKLVAFFEKRGKELLAINKKQAMLPDGCVVIENDRGTAPGMWFEQDGKIVVSMPGVPYEMKAMVENQVLPKIKQQFELPNIIHKNLMLIGIGESAIAQRLTDFENNLPATIKLAYLPELSVVKLRLSCIVNDVTIEKEIQNRYDEMVAILADYVFAKEEKTIEAALIDLLSANAIKMATAESCTGGYTAHLITSVAGSSACFIGGVVAYSAAMKTKLLAVSPDTIRTETVYSEACAKEMLQGLLSATGADVGVAITGIAGPDGGLPEKPVGTVYFAVGSATAFTTHTFTFFKHREQNVRISAITAINLVRKWVLENK